MTTESEAMELHKQQKDSVDVVLNDLHRMFNGKNSSYRVSPLITLPEETWEHQIRIKAERLLQALDPAKKNDEAMDCAVYCILYLAKKRQEVNS